MWRKLIFCLLVAYSYGQISCDICKWTYNTIYNTITSNATLSLIKIGWRLFCPLVLDYDIKVCDQLYENVCVLMGKNLLRRFDGDILCPKLKLCTHPILISDDFNKFRNKILLDKPPRIYTVSSGKEMRFAVMADLHVDMAYSTVIN